MFVEKRFRISFWILQEIIPPFQYCITKFLRISAIFKMLPQLASHWCGENQITDKQIINQELISKDHCQ